MENNNINSNISSNYSKLIINILEKYELKDSYFIINGLQLVGIENIQFWLDFVNYVDTNQSLNELGGFITIMSSLDNHYLKEAIKIIKIKKDFEVFQNFLIKDTLTKSLIR